MHWTDPGDQRLQPCRKAPRVESPMHPSLSRSQAPPCVCSAPGSSQDLPCCITDLSTARKETFAARSRANS